VQIKDLTHNGAIELDNTRGGAYIAWATPTRPSIGSPTGKVATTDVGNPVPVKPESLTFPLRGLILR
jgi:hypothetical protein